jgi:molybdopterin converting factor small subunit
MKVQVELFGELGLGAEESPVLLELGPGSTVADAISQLQFRSGEVWLAKIGQALVDRDHRLQDGDTLVLFPAVGGG